MWPTGATCDGVVRARVAATPASAPAREGKGLAPGTSRPRIFSAYRITVLYSNIIFLDGEGGPGSPNVTMSILRESGALDPYCPALDARGPPCGIPSKLRTIIFLLHFIHHPTYVQMSN